MGIGIIARDFEGQVIVARVLTVGITGLNGAKSAWSFECCKI
jgi:hypothetical protein